VATLTYVYSDSTAVVGPLATVREPHSWDLCLGHASRITAPRGWELVRHAAPLPTNPDEDDLVALAEAVREGRDGRGGGRGGMVAGGSPVHGFSDAGVSPSASSGTGVPAGVPRIGSAGRRRGHLRVLPDPTD